MVRFSQTLDDKQSKNRENPYDDKYRMHSQEPQPAPRTVYRQREVTPEQDNFYTHPPREEPTEIIYERPQIERESIQRDYSKPELDFPKNQNIQFGVEYSPNSKPPVIG